MLHFNARMHQIRFWLELLPDPTVGAYIAAPDALAGFNWPFF